MITLMPPFLGAFFCLFFYTLGASRIDKNAPIFGLGVLPVLFIDSTFNGMRYGMGFALASYLLAEYHTSNSKLRFFLLLLPGFLHSSLLLLILILPFAVVIVPIALFFYTINTGLFFDIFLYKFDSYSSMARPNSFSGIVPILSFVSFCVIYFLNTRKFFNVLPLGRIAILIFLIGIFLSYFSYAGLRFLLMSVFLIAISVSIDSKSAANNKSSLGSLIIGILILFNFYRQIFWVGVEGDVYFHPYSFGF